MLRACIALLGLGAAGFAVALMLSDRAPGLLREVFGDRARRLWNRIDASEPAHAVTQGDLPEPDFVVHVVVWCVVVMLVAMAIWTWRGLVGAAIGVFAASVVLEAAQARFSTTRSVQRNDVVANGLGVAAGTCAVALILLAWTAIARWAGGRRAARPAGAADR